MKKSVLILAVLLVVSLFIYVSAKESNVTTLATKETVNTNEVQEVKLTFENYEYKLEPSTLRKDIPVRMEVDLNTVTGCLRDIVISSFNVRKQVKQGDNIIEFTPNKAGTFNIACSMNMGRGKFTVVDETGFKSEYVEPQATGGSCSMGGCGCGIR